MPALASITPQEEEHHHERGKYGDLGRIRPERRHRRPSAPTLSIHRAHPRPAGTSAWKAFERQVREEPPFYVPDILSANAFDADPELCTAADEHVRHLHRAQRGIEDALNLSRVLSASFEGDGDSRAVQAETVPTVIDRKLNKALNRLDRHDARHRNLFFAYFEPAEKAKAEERDEE